MGETGETGETGGEEKEAGDEGSTCTLSCWLLNLVPLVAAGPGLMGGVLLFSLSSRMRPVERSLARAAAIIESVISSLGGGCWRGEAAAGEFQEDVGLGGGGGGGALWTRA